MCTIEGCDARAVAKGLCAKHYMRVRRQGSAEITGVAGRPRDVVRGMQRELLRDQSDRTFARMQKALRILNGLEGYSGDTLIEAFTRPNGTVNVARMLETAELVELATSEGITLDQAAMQLVLRRLKPRQSP